MIADRIRAVRARIDDAARAAGRSPSSVHLVAVSKTFPATACVEAVAAGQADLGENYAQELRDKAPVVLGARWHFVGRVQSNKARYIAPHAYRIHALEEVRHAEALVERAPAGVDALLYVDVGREPTKGGVPPEQVLARLDELARVPGLRVRGLMCLPPAVDDPEAAAPFFSETADLLVRARAAGHALDELSMGMSHDFEVAIRHGATWVRVGSAIFGARG